MPPQFREFLNDMYCDDIEQLYDRFGDRVAGWRVA